LVLFILFLIINENINFLLIQTFLILKNTYKYKNIFNDLNNIKFNYKIKGIKFLNKCLKKKIIKINKDIIQFPKISVIIPVYNCQNSIQMSIKSIQYQKLDEYEIILVNDFSNDKSLEIIQNIKKYDKRIHVINNQKNMGTLYSRSLGALKAKGKYIFALDNDDIFFNENLFEKIFQIAENNNYDIVEFKPFDIPNYHPNIYQIKDGYFNHHKNNLILKQPNLGIFPISKNKKYYANDYYLWGKCIKSSIYKRSINSLGYERFSRYNIWTEDISIIIIIFNYAESYIYLNVYGIFHLISNNTTTNKISEKHRIISKIYLLDILIDYLKNDYKSKVYAIYVVNTIKTKEIKKLNDNQKLFFKSVLKKISNCKYYFEIY
jgi:glycosyltransferase involved in cell wall biosynthesis